MTPLQALAVGVAGVVAGAINALVGSGTLVTFPTLLAVGIPPVTANVTNTVGLWPGSVTAAWAYRRELAGQRVRLIQLGVASTIGALVGGVLLLALPADTFRIVVPVLIVASCVLVVLQPRIRTALESRGRRPSGAVTPLLAALVGLSGVYGGFFGAGQGIILLALLGTLLDSDLQRASAAKNVLAGLVNVVAAVLFVCVARVHWDAAALIAVGSIVGGGLGGRYGRRLPAGALRALVVVIGLTAIAKLLLSG